jgi:hypothetical protein
LSGFIHDQNKAGITPLLTAERIHQVERMSVPRLGDRAERLLVALASAYGNTDVRFYAVDDARFQAMSYSADESQMRLLLEILSAGNFLESRQGIFRITAEGFLRVEGLSASNQGSVQAFVAMSFDPSMNESFSNGFDVGVRSAGYAPLRIDRKEHVNGISDEILSEIRRSRFLIADYTQMNNGVYFEAGFAMGLGIPVVPTCRADFVNKLHFDIRHINTLIWKDPSDLAGLLATRISAVIGDGPLVHSARRR